jgi:hypothetical protein
MERLIAKASVEQRCVLGFPRPGHSYWTQETIAAVQARYGSLGIDMTPYAHALALPRPREDLPNGLLRRETLSLFQPLVAGAAVLVSLAARA